ncbi:MAG: hypothetical protein LAO18_23555, partial [Acidobacteriia bacterium]|nr:hypothetical protein [Terriglobia bacterium]
WRLVPSDRARNNITVVMGFMPSWWEHEYGIKFGRNFHLDRKFHVDSLVRMEQLLLDRFGDLPDFSHGEDYSGGCAFERMWGDALIPALFGCEVSFDGPSGHPYAYELGLDDSRVQGLTIPDIESHPVTQSLRPRGDREALGMKGELGFEGVINVAYKLRGQQLFVDMVDAPERARHIFEVVWKTIDEFVRMVRTWQDPLVDRPTYFVNCNCMVNMLSPQMYEEQLLEFDKRFAQQFELFGIHTCNWTVDPYLDSIKQIQDLAYLDMGADSNLEKVHELFPRLYPAVFLHPEEFRSLSPEDITKEVTRIGKALGKGYVLLSDLEVGTSDNQIRAAYEAAACS